MMSWPSTFLVIALIAAVFGFGALAGTAAAWAAKICFLIFLALFTVTALRGENPIDV